METAATLIINGLVTSAMYILVALGFALLLSIMGVFNFAHGAIYMIGAYVTYGFSVELGINQWLALLLSIIFIGIFGLFLERFCFRPFVGNINGVVMMAIAIILILETTINITLGGTVRALPSFVSGVFKTQFFSVSADRLITLLIGGILLVVMTLFIQKSKIGQQMMAIAQDSTGAELQGININRTSAIATMIACSLAALSGSLMGALFSVNPFMGDNVLLKAIQVVVLSGIGSMNGILIAGLIVGFVDATLPVFTNSGVAQAVGFVIIIVILLLRPKGLFGHELF
jgi:branched-chain amino acid transport system permease protein